MKPEKPWITIESETLDPKQRKIMEETLSECLQPYQAEILKRAVADTANLIIHGKNHETLPLPTPRLD